MTDPLPDASTWYTGSINAGKINTYIVNPTNTIGHDTGWVTLSVTAAGFSAGSPAPKYRRIGSTVKLTGVIQSTSSVAVGIAFNGTAIFSALPTDCRPATYVIQATWCGATTGAKPEIQVLADGTVQVRNMGTVAIGANTNIGIDCTFLAG